MKSPHRTQILGALFFTVLVGAVSAREQAELVEATNQPTPGLPDLVEGELITPGWPVSCGPPQAPTVSICVANVGAAAAGPFSVSGQNIGVHYDFFRLDALGAGERRCTEAPSFPLDAEVVVTVDSGNEVQESNEDNNSRWDFISFVPIPTCTATALPTPTSTPTPAALLCVGDCSGDGAVTVDEIVRLVTIALNGEPSPNACPASEQWCNSGSPECGVAINCVIAAVTNALNGCPMALPTPSPTPTLTGVIRYRLTSGSTILVTAPTPGSAPISVPLSGTFTVFRSQHPPPNTFIGLTIAHVDFRGGSQLAITDARPKPYGCAQEISLGCIDALTFDPTHVYVSALVSINGEDLGLGGGEYLDSPSDLPTFHNLEMCGGPSFQSCDAIRSGTASGYVLTIAAMPEPTASLVEATAEFDWP